MRLIIQYTISDGCTYWSSVTECCVYSSVEECIVDFKKFCESYVNTIIDNIPLFGGQQFNPCDFYEEGKYYPPMVMTVDEWYSQVEGDSL